MTTPARAVLNEYTCAAATIERNGIVITILEQNHDATSTRCIKLLEAEQQRQLVKLDKAAAKLGAPYPVRKS